MASDPRAPYHRDMSDSDTPPSPESGSHEDGQAGDASNADTETRATGAQPDPKEDLREAFDSLKSAAGALFKQVQPAVKEVLSEAEKLAKQAAEGAKPAANAAKEEASKAAHQIGESAKPFAKSVGEQLHKLTDAMADAVDSGVKGAGVAADTVKEAFTGKSSDDETE